MSSVPSQPRWPSLTALGIGAAVVVALLAALLLAPASAIAGSADLSAEQTGSVAGPGATATAAARSTAQASRSPTPAAATATATVSLELLLPTPTLQPVPPAVTATAVVLELPEPEVLATPTPETISAPVEGTIIVNRTEARVRFFVEGATQELQPLRSLGLNFERPTAVLNLYNCDAAFGETQSGCFWDPYLLQRDGFYEVVSGAEANALVSLVLREAGSPPTGQVWIHNRTAVAEQVYFGTQMHEIAPAAIAEFAVASNEVGTFYLRTCVSSVTESASAPVCEWTAHSAAPGAYYALVAEEWQGSVPGAVVVDLELEPVLATASSTVTVAGDGTTTTMAAAGASSMVCRLAVPALNVRSGPGLGFEIVSKVRSTDVEVATVAVTSRTEDNLWLRVDERVATGGWVINGAEYLSCDGDVLALPVVPASELPATPTPLPLAALPADAAPAESAPADAAVVLTETVSPGAAAIPAGLAYLHVNNGFDQSIRFTLDQTKRVEIGSSEFDLLPGASVSILVYPGMIEFSASSAWQELSGNANFWIDQDSERSLWLAFIPDPGEPGNWVLVY